MEEHRPARCGAPSGEKLPLTSGLTQTASEAELTAYFEDFENIHVA